ncbi:MAG: hypothetical protein ACRDZ7_01555 [Acidimicrobiia bacterium]
MMLLALAAAAPLSACAKAEESASAKAAPYKLELISEAENLNRLTLEPEPIQRIGIKAEKVGLLVRFGGESQRTTVPYSALLYDHKGAGFVYTNPEPRVYLRHPVTVDYVEGDLAVLAAGPPRGTVVVTVGGAQLQGIEFGVGK